MTALLTSTGLADAYSLALSDGFIKHITGVTEQLDGIRLDEGLLRVGTSCGRPALQPGNGEKSSPNPNLSRKMSSHTPYQSNSARQTLKPKPHQPTCRFTPKPHQPILYFGLKPTDQPNSNPWRPRCSRHAHASYASTLANHHRY